MNVTAEQEAAVDLVRAKNRPLRDRSHMGALSIYGNLDASDLWPMGHGRKSSARSRCLYERIYMCSFPFRNIPQPRPIQPNSMLFVMNDYECIPRGATLLQSARGPGQQYAGKAEGKHRDGHPLHVPISPGVP